MCLENWGYILKTGDNIQKRSGISYYFCCNNGWGKFYFIYSFLNGLDNALLFGSFFACRWVLKLYESNISIESGMISPKKISNRAFWMLVLIVELSAIVVSAI